jgi:hypothetical protein
MGGHGGDCGGRSGVVAREQAYKMFLHISLSTG